MATIAEKSVSKAQQSAMGIAHAIQKGEVKPKPGTPSADIAKSMKPGDVEDFASTKRKGLPKKKSSSTNESFANRLQRALFS